jgi:iron complex outermembrane receptor protein
MYALMATTVVAAASTHMPAAVAQSQQRNFRVAAGPLADALSSFGHQAGVQITYRPELAFGKNSSTISGRLSTDSALSRLLAGTGLSYRYINSSTIAVFAREDSGNASGLPGNGSVRLNTITVTGGESPTGPVTGIIAQNSSSGTRTDTPIIETPQTVNVVGTDQMRQQGVTNVGEALRYTPGILTGTAGGQADRHDSYFVRGEGGFSAEAQYASTLDGMRWRFSDRTSVQFDPWMLERVEVVKGPSSTLFGAGTPGGIVNLVSKRPSFEKQNRVFASIGSYDSAGTGFDFTGPINDQFAYRFVGSGRLEGNGVDYQKGERLLFAPSLTWAPTTDTSVTLYGLYQRDPKSVDAGFAPAYGSVLPVPGYGRVDASFWQGDPDWNEYSRTETAVGTEIKHSFNDNWKMTGKFRYGHLESTTKAMDYVAMVDQVTMMRTIYLAEHDNDMVNADLFVEGKLDTGPAEHTVVFGADHQRLTGGHKDGWDRLQYPTINIFNPERGVTPNVFGTFREFEQPFKQTGLYAQDQVAIGNWRFLGGLRYDRVDAETSTLVTLNGASAYASTSNSAVTGRIGAVYLFDNGIAPFVSYSTSFNPQPKFKYDGTMLEPYTGKMWEGGVRYQSSDDTLFLSATFFSGTKDGVGAAATCEFETSRPLDNCFTDGTSAKSRGVELEARAQLVNGLDLIGAVTWQKIRWEEYEGVGEDLHVVAVPDVTAALWLNYKIPEGNLGYGWSLGGGVRYVGSTYATPDNKWNDQPEYGAYYYEYEGQPSKVPSFTVFDASIAYDFGALDKKYEGLEGRLSVANLFDKHYVAACNGYGTCSFGKRREIAFRLDYTW